MKPETVPIIAHAIQLAVAPVFLLTGIGALLAVMAGRLARVIDRARALQLAWVGLDEPARAVALKEFGVLLRRRHLATWSINFCAYAALLVCVVIVTLFIEEFFLVNLKWLAGALFVGAMFALIFGLASFLREVYLAATSLRIEFPGSPGEKDGGPSNPMQSALRSLKDRAPDGL